MMMPLRGKIKSASPVTCCNKSPNENKKRKHRLLGRLSDHERCEVGVYPASNKKPKLQEHHQKKTKSNIKKSDPEPQTDPGTINPLRHVRVHKPWYQSLPASRTINPKFLSGCSRFPRDLSRRGSVRDPDSEEATLSSVVHSLFICRMC